MKRLFILALVVLLFCSCAEKWIFLEDAVLAEGEYVKEDILTSGYCVLTFNNGLTIRQNVTSYAVGKVYEIYSKPKSGKFKAILKAEE